MLRTWLARALTLGQTGAVAAGLSLMIGVALNAVVLQMLWDAFGRSLPYRAASELVTVVVGGGSRPSRDALTESEATALRGLADLFRETAIVERWPVTRRTWMDYEAPGGAVRVAGAFTVPNLFRVLGVTVHGRDFSDADGATDARVAIVSAAFARRWFEAEGPLGKRIRLSGETFEIIGMLPGDFIPPFGTPPRAYQQVPSVDVWGLLDSSRIRGGEGGGLAYNFVARLSRPGGSLGALSTEVTRRIASRGGRPAKEGYAVADLRAVMLGDRASGFRTVALLAAVLFAVAVANVVIVALLRVEGQQREIAIRTAVGAAGWRTWARPMMPWSALVCCSAVLGALVAAALGSVLSRHLPELPWSSEHGDLAWIALASAAVAAALAAVAGLGLALHFHKWTSPARLLMATGDNRGSSKMSVLMRIVMACQLALSLVLAAPAIGLWWGLTHARSAHVALEREDVLVAEAWILDRTAPDSKVLEERKTALLQKVRMLPGVKTVGIGSDAPFVGGRKPLWIASIVGPNTKLSRLLAFGDAVDAEYLTTLGLRPIRGRSLEDGDQLGAKVAVVSAAFAERAFGSLDVVGREIEWRGVRRIVGVVTDQKAVDGSAKPSFYVPWQDVPLMKVCLLATVVDGAAAPSVAKSIRRLDEEQPIDSVESLAALIRTAFIEQRTYMNVALILCVAAVSLGFSGLYLVTKYWVRRAATEIGIRLSFGATRTHVATHFAGRQLRFLVLTFAWAVPVAWMLVRKVSEAVVPVQVPVLATVVIVTISILASSLVVTLGLAWRGTRSSPASILNQDGRRLGGHPSDTSRVVRSAV